MKPTKKVKSIIISILCLALSLTQFYGCQTPINTPAPSEESKSFESRENNESSKFDDYTRELFIQEVTSNTINLHYTLKDPEAYGIKDYKISLGNLSREDMENSVSQLENMKAVLDSFDSDALNDRQRLTLAILKDYCDGELGISDLTYYSEPLRPTTGVTSELPVLLAEYSFSNQKDVTDYLTLLGNIQEYFASILDFEKQKSKEGLFMSDTAVNTILESCRSFTIDPENNYLISTFNTRIDKLEDVPEEKKETYKTQNRNLILQKVVPAYQSMIDELSKLKGSGKNEKGLCHFPKGKEYYAYLVKSYTGSDRSIEDLQKLTETQRNSDIINIQQITAKNPSLLLISQGADITVESPESALNLLQEKMLSDFPAATNTSFEVNYVHESLQDALAPAFYLTAPLDDLDHNVIYINKKSGYQGVQLFTTLAHEGYPGHLYQTTGSHAAGLEPVRSLLNYPGFVEGWATYVEMISYKYMDLEAEISNILMYNQSALLSLYATVDMGIHNDGWSLDDVKKFFEDYGIKDEETIQSIYELIVQEPAHYLKYYIGYLEFLELKKDMKEAWGNKYTDLEFHKRIVEAGPMPFYILREYLLQ
ncbi:MAG: DUF885 domain-containing protein [Lachnospiraceae bacterium]|nr:DUF885 domain-containing protein [Lachnospiraceae bacterium]MDE6980339.1 DUF885 domain-containing protein [Lachnospiraceae bacterium]